MTRNSGESSATKTPSKNVFSYASNTRVSVWAYGVPRLLVQYWPQRNFVVFNVIVTTLTPLTSKKINGRMQTFSIRHALSCLKGSLVITRHNEIHDNILPHGDRKSVVG